MVLFLIGLILLIVAVVLASAIIGLALIFDEYKHLEPKWFKKISKFLFKNLL
ncbi:MAG: hypothetical protein IJZ62_04120 [Clostridia bacterium]|nr:hypothetical protein [Clostridia bacterium]